MMTETQTADDTDDTPVISIANVTGPSRAAVLWAVTVVHLEHALASIHVAGRSPDYGDALDDAARIIRDLQMPDDFRLLVETKAEESAHRLTESVMFTREDVLNYRRHET